MNTLRFRAIVEDQASRSLDRIKKGFDGIGGPGSSASLFGNVGAMAVSKGFGLIDRAASAVIGVLGDATQAALAEEASIAKLDAALQANLPSWDGQRDKIEQVLQSRMRLGFSDDEQRESLALLVAATKDETRALELQRTAMDLARLKRIDLKTASEGLIKVEAGSFRILKSLGIQLKDNATAEEALTAVRAVAQGQAEAYAQTNEGKLLASQVKVGEAMERLGARIVPLVVVAIEFAAEKVEQLIGGLDLLDQVLGNLAPKAADGAKETNLLGDAFATLNPLDVSSKLERVGDTLDSLGVNSEGFRSLFAGMGLQVETTAAKVTSVTSHMADASKDDFREMADELPAALEDARDYAVRIAAGTPGAIADALRSKRSRWQDEIDQLGSDLEKEMTEAAEMAKIKAELAGENLARGLASKDPVVRAQAEETKNVLLNRLAEITEDARVHGKSGGQQYARGWSQAAGAIETSMQKVSRIVNQYLRVMSPAEKGPLSEGGGPEGWGARGGKLYGEGWASSLRSIGQSLDSSLRGAGVGISGSGSMAMGGVGTGRGVSVTVPLYINGREFARATMNDVDEELYWRQQSAGGATIEG